VKGEGERVEIKRDGTGVVDVNGEVNGQKDR